MIKNLIIISVLLTAFIACEESESVIEAVKNKTEDSNEDPLERFNKIIRENPESSNGFFKRANYYASVFDYENAKRDINLCINMDPEVAIYHYTKSELAYKTGQIDQCEIYAKEALKYDSEMKEAYLLLGKIYAAIPNFDKAISTLDSALLIDKYYAEPYFYKGLVFGLVGDTLRAVSSYQTAVQQNPDYYEAYIELGLLYAQNETEDRKLAMDYFNNALAIKPTSIEALLAKGVYSQDNGKLVEAHQCYTSILELDPKFEVAYYNRGYVSMIQYQDNGDQDWNDSIMLAGINDFSNAIEINENYVQAYHNRGVCYEALNDLAAAKLDYQTSLKLEPTFKPSIDAVARLK